MTEVFDGTSTNSDSSANFSPIITNILGSVKNETEDIAKSISFAKRSMQRENSQSTSKNYSQSCKVSRKKKFQDTAKSKSAKQQKSFAVNAMPSVSFQSTTENISNSCEDNNWLNYVPCIEIPSMPCESTENGRKSSHNDDNIVQAIGEYVVARMEPLIQFYTSQLRTEIRDLDTKVDQLLYKCQQRNVVNSTTFEKKHCINLPTTTMSEFEVLDAEVSKEDVAEDFEAALNAFYNTNERLTKNLVTILKFCMSRDVALAFTAIKKTGEKRIFSTTNIYVVIQTFLLRKYTEENQRALTKTDVDKALGTVLANAKDWDGMRKQRDILPI